MRRSLLWPIALLCWQATGTEAQDAPPPAPADKAAVQVEQAPPSAPFTGMDESVNIDLANKAGVPARTPYIDVESLGDLWNFILLTGGAVCGFVLGRYWDQIWGRAK